MDSLVPPKPTQKSKYKYLHDSNVTFTQTVEHKKEADKKHINDFEVLETIGKGAYSKVKRVQKEDKQYGLKQMFKPSLKKSIISEYTKDGGIVMSNCL
jgi:hypothetical protein